MTDNTYRLPVMETVKAAWSKVRGTKGSIWAVVALFILVQIVVGILADLGTKGGVVNLIFNLIGSLIQVFAGASVIYLGIRRAQDLPVHYKMIKDVLTPRILLYLIGLYILQLIVLIPVAAIIAIGVWIVHMHAEPSTAIQVIGVLFYAVATILFIYLSVRMWLGYGAVVDKNLNPWEALRLTFKATAGNVWNLIGLFFINLLVMIACAITAGIGLIWGIPWLVITYGEAYKRLSTRQDMRPIGQLQG